MGDSSGLRVVLVFVLLGLEILLDEGRLAAVEPIRSVRKAFENLDNVPILSPTRCQDPKVHAGQ